MLTGYFDVFALIEGVFQSVFYQSPSGEVDIFADGGLVVNYPIFAFDGKLTSYFILKIILLHISHTNIIKYGSVFDGFLEYRMFVDTCKSL